MKKRGLIVFCLILLTAAPAFAITAGDVLDRMSLKEQAAYLGGTVEMAMYLSGSQSNGEHASCILNWFYSKEGTAQDEVLATFGKYRDKPAAGLIKVLIVRHCGEFAKK